MSNDYDDYDDTVADFDALGTTENVSFELYTSLGATYMDGQVRNQYKVSEDSVPMFEKERTDYRISVQRLLWIDGYRDKEQEPLQEMTLVVLKFLFTDSSTGSNNIGSPAKISNVKATLKFLDTDKNRQQHPKVIAWAPFTEREQWNPSAVHFTNTTATSATAAVGYQGVQVGAARSIAREVSWDQTTFDSGYAYQEYSPQGQPYGISWSLKQNAAQKQGVTPEFWAAVLVSRASAETYLVRFTITATGRDRVLQKLGLREDGSSFSVTPKLAGVAGQAGICNLEGRDIIKHVDWQHLGKLVDPDKSTRLRVAWGPAYQVVPPALSKPEGEGERDATPTKGEEATPTKASTTRDDPATSTTRTSWSDIGSKASKTSKAIQDQDAEAPVDADVDGNGNGDVDDKWQQTRAEAKSAVAVSPARPEAAETTSSRRNIAPSPAPSGADLATRLVALEARAAQTEMRLAAQDQVILQLQQAMLAKDAQLGLLGRIEHAFREASGSI